MVRRLLDPARGPHPEAAHKFLEFHLASPKVIAGITNEIHYGNDNAAANAFVDPALLADPAIYPSSEAMLPCVDSAEVNGPIERLRTRTWTRIKTGH